MISCHEDLHEISAQVPSSFQKPTDSFEGSRASSRMGSHKDRFLRHLWVGGERGASNPGIFMQTGAQTTPRKGSRYAPIALRLNIDQGSRSEGKRKSRLVPSLISMGRCLGVIAGWDSAVAKATAGKQMARSEYSDIVTSMLCLASNCKTIETFIERLPRESMGECCRSSIHHRPPPPSSLLAGTKRPRRRSPSAEIDWL